MEAQYGITRVLRPYPGFETQYNGVTAARPIMLTEDGIALDDEATNRVPGVDPRLVRGLTVPLGAGVKLWLPNLLADNGGGTTVPYTYTFSWRLRSVRTHRGNSNTRPPFHFRDDSGGVPETITSSGPRFVIPVAIQGVIYTQTEGTATALQTQQLHGENIRQGGQPFPGNPINPDGVLGALEQGIRPSVASGAHLRQFFTTYNLEAEGDELLVEVSRDTGSFANWQFSGGAPSVDLAFSEFYGSGLAGGPFPNLGVYVQVGSSG